MLTLCKLLSVCPCAFVCPGLNRDACASLKIYNPGPGLCRQPFPEFQGFRESLIMKMFKAVAIKKTRERDNCGQREREGERMVEREICVVEGNGAAGS